MTRMLNSLMTDGRRRWAALFVVCLGQLMIVLDTTIVNVALPAIQDDLGFSQANLTWVVNAYLIAFGSFLLLAGRLGDLFGRRRVFLYGLVVFTFASILCGVAGSEGMLIAARFLQGIGGALASSVVLAIIFVEFQEARERDKAMGIFSAVATSGASIGLLAGGVLTQSLDWHWIFFINVPIGIAALAAGRVLIDADEANPNRGRVDYVGAALVTIATMVGVYAIVGATEHGWGSVDTLGFGALAVALFAGFLAFENRIAEPIMPLRILRLRSLSASNAVRGGMITGMFAVFFLGALYLEQVRGFDALEIGFAFLPISVTIGVLSVLLSARLANRFGNVRMISLGMASMVAGLLLLATLGATTAYFPTMFFALLLMGIGPGLAFNPLISISLAEVEPQDAGLASGMVQVSMQLAAAAGLAVLSTLATNHTNGLIADGSARADALTDGFQLAYLIAAIVVAGGIAIAVGLMRAYDGRAPHLAEERAEAVAERAEAVALVAEGA